MTIVKISCIGDWEREMNITANIFQDTIYELKG